MVLPLDLTLYESVQACDKKYEESYAEGVELYRGKEVGSENMHATSVT